MGMTTAHLTEERNTLPGSDRIDAEAGVIRGAKLVGMEAGSKKRRYPSKTLKEGAHLYEGVDVNVDHSLAGGRKLLEGWGVVRNPRFQDGVGIVGDVHFLKEHASTGQILERIERFPDGQGLSHDARGKIRLVEQGWQEVTHLQSVKSVDLVRKPDTTKNLFEDQDTEPKTMKASEFLAGKTDDRSKRLIALLEAGELIDLDLTEDVSDDIAAGRLLHEGVAEDDPLKRLEVLRKYHDPGGKFAVRPKEEKRAATDDQATAQLREEVDQLKFEIGLRDLLEDKGLVLGDMPEKQRKLLESADSVEKAEELLEAFDVKPAATAPRTRPAIQSRHRAAPDDFETLREQVLSKK